MKKRLKVFCKSKTTKTSFMKFYFILCEFYSATLFLNFLYNFYFIIIFFIQASLLIILY